MSQEINISFSLFPFYFADVSLLWTASKGAREPSIEILTCVKLTPEGNPSISSNNLSRTNIQLFIVNTRRVMDTILLK